MLSVQQLTGGYSGDSIIKNVSFEIDKGELFGILGPNGSGKTTLLKMISGILPYSSGKIELIEKSLKDYSPKELAKIIAVLPQHSIQSFSYTVKETVSLGRYAHQKGWFQTWSHEDEKIVMQAMEQTGVAHYENHYIHELSGGERQRVYLAQALAQEPEILLLDEPTNHLDLSFQKDLLDMLKDWTKNRGLTVISIFHDLNLAGLYCDRLLLLENGEININHTPNEVLREDRIRDVYNTKIEKHPHPKVPAPQMVLLPEDTDEKIDFYCINESYLERSNERLVLRSPIPLRTMSSGVVGSGTGWNQMFVNRHVDKNYDCSDHRKEMQDYLKVHGFEPGETVGMMTAVMLEDVSFQLYKKESFAVFILVTAGVGNAIDAARSEQHAYHLTPGTINTWIFVSGELTEEAFIQSIMTATEAKAKALQDQEVKDAVTGTIATGTSTDSILIAATQRGTKLEYAGTITPLGKLIGKGVYECTLEAVQKSKKRVTL
ncbi:adenosylcobinamide amidohydrolase [Cytobacillus dafuensis]|uniref:ATP-binding cassette domain-containing protein n=1 Tax=Cytobacillus dafuensis TaxID=1742359 RepID=A0A5B8Z400_CYTDA|nr:adenosylcobinamide amidohydrolase [Cytobacillus dafuensis]QED46339.1 ATP-binding cassette domain-containing protein [Cytobacillus dafuensis]